MGRQGAIRAARAQMKRDGRPPEEIPARPASFTERREATIRDRATIDALRAELQRARADMKDAEDIYAEVAAERDGLRSQVENLEAARAELTDQVAALQAELAQRDEMLRGLEVAGAELAELGAELAQAVETQAVKDVEPADCTGGPPITVGNPEALAAASLDKLRECLADFEADSVKHWTALRSGTEMYLDIVSGTARSVREAAEEADCFAWFFRVLIEAKS